MLKKILLAVALAAASFLSFAQPYYPGAGSVTGGTTTCTGCAASSVLITGSGTNPVITTDTGLTYNASTDTLTAGHYKASTAAGYGLSWGTGLYMTSTRDSGGRYGVMVSGDGTGTASGMTGWTFGNHSTTISAIWWSGETRTANNYALAAYAGGTEINAASGDSIFFSANGTTTRWQIDSSGHFIAGADNTYDIGASGATRPRNVYAATALVISTAQSPASNAACTAGTHAWDTDYVYVCTASGVWKRAALTGGY